MKLIFKVNVTTKASGIDLFQTKIFVNKIKTARRWIENRPEYRGEDIKIDFRWIDWIEDGVLPERFEIISLKRGIKNVNNLDAWS